MRRRKHSCVSCFSPLSIVHDCRALWFVLLVLSFPAEGQANSQILSDPLNFLSRNQADLLHLSSKEDAIEFFLHSNEASHTKHIKSQGRGKISSKINIPDNIQEAISRFMAGLVVFAAAGEGDAEARKNSDGVERLPNLMNLSESQHQWIAETSLMEHWVAIESLHTLLVSLPPSSQIPQVAEDPTYLRFANYFDASSSGSTDSLGSFMEIAKENGIQGLEDKFKEFWQSHQTDLEAHVTESAKTLYGQYYLVTRLAPRFRDALNGYYLSLQTEALELILSQIPIISDWQKQVVDTKKVNRICGSWLWTVHNHQNHQDHKMTVHFFPPGQPVPPHQPAPSSIAIHGDTVYLEWIFPQGRQEDSLLLSNRDTILEGTFKNSLGPYGSISGKRLTTCRS